MPDSNYILSNNQNQDQHQQKALRLKCMSYKHGNCNTCQNCIVKSHVMAYLRFIEQTKDHIKDHYLGSFLCSSPLWSSLWHNWIHQGYKKLYETYHCAGLFDFTEADWDLLSGLIELTWVSQQSSSWFIIGFSWINMFHYKNETNLAQKESQRFTEVIKVHHSSGLIIAHFQLSSLNFFSKNFKRATVHLCCSKLTMPTHQLHIIMNKKNVIKMFIFSIYQKRLYLYFKFFFCVCTEGENDEKTGGPENSLRFVYIFRIDLICVHCSFRAFFKTKKKFKYKKSKLLWKNPRIFHILNMKIRI